MARWRAGVNTGPVVAPVGRLPRPFDINGLLYCICGGVGRPDAAQARDRRVQQHCTTLHPAHLVLAGLRPPGRDAGIDLDVTKSPVASVGAMLGRLEGCTRCRCCELSPSRPHLRLAPFSTATALPTRATWFSSAPWELAARSGMVARSAPLPVGTPMPAWLAWLRSDRNYVTSECNRGRRGAGYVVSPLQTVIQILSHRSARSVRRASQSPAQGLRLGSGSHGSNSKYSLIHGRAIAYQSTLQSLATPVRNGPKAARVHGACPAPPPPGRQPAKPCAPRPLQPCCRHEISWKPPRRMLSPAAAPVCSGQRAMRGGCQEVNTDHPSWPHACLAKRWCGARPASGWDGMCALIPTWLLVDASERRVNCNCCYGCGAASTHAHALMAERCANG